MGTYLNPGKASYEEAVNSEIFIDKTEMIQYLNSLVNTKQKYVSVSRPRRFGKTMAADMICAYYDREADSYELFSKRKLSGTSPVKKGDNEIAWDGYLDKFDVIRLVMTDFLDGSDTVPDMLNYLTEEVVEDHGRLGKLAAVKDAANRPVCGRAGRCTGRRRQPEPVPGCCPLTANTARYSNVWTTGPEAS